MKKIVFYTKKAAAAACYLAFAIIVTGCGGTGSPANGNGRTPSWNAPQRLAALADFGDVDFVFGAGRFFAFGPDRDKNPLVKTSTNGTRWNNVTTPLFGNFSEIDRIVFGGGRFLAFGSTGEGGSRGLLVKASTNGTSWNDVTSDFTSIGFAGIIDILFAGGRIFVFGVDHDENPLAKTSTDSTNWSDVSSGFGNFNWRPDIAYGEGTFLASGKHSDYTALVKYSTDGTNWSDVSYNFTDFYWLGPVVFIGGRFFASGISLTNWETLAKTSTDGVSWSDISPGLSDFMWVDHIVFDGERFFAFGVGSWPLVKYSMDGTNWTNVTSDLGYDFGRGLNVIVDEGRILVFGWNFSGFHHIVVVRS